MNDARYDVDLDTSRAKSDLRGLQREKQQTGRRVYSASRRVASRAMQAAAFAGVAAKLGSFRPSSASGNVDLGGEALLPTIAAAQQFADSQLGFSAAARKTAREQTKATFAYFVGSTGETAGMREFYNDVSRIQEDVESGRNILRRDPRFVGITPADYATATIQGNVEVFLENLKSSPFRVLMRGFEYVAEGILAP